MIWELYTKNIKKDKGKKKLPINLFSMNMYVDRDSNKKSKKLFTIGKKIGARDKNNETK